MNAIILAAYRDDLRTRLRAQGLIHLDVLVRGSHVVVYGLEPDDEKVNRARLTWLLGQTFALSIADPRRGRWNATGETGPFDRLVTLLLQQFDFILADW